jgi:hypothetical protein
MTSRNWSQCHRWNLTKLCYEIQGKFQRLWFCHIELWNWMCLIHNTKCGSFLISAFWHKFQNTCGNYGATSLGRKHLATHVPWCGSITIFSTFLAIWNLSFPSMYFFSLSSKYYVFETWLAYVTRSKVVVSISFIFIKEMMECAMKQ